jgi:hypothetical protein
MATQLFQPFYNGAAGETNVSPDRLALIALLPGESTAAAQARMRANSYTIQQYPVLGLPGAPGRNTIGLSATMRYSTDNSGTLRIDGQSAFGYSAYQMSIRRQDGVAMSLSNADNPSLQSDVFYPSSPQFDWTLYNVPQVPIVLTFKKGFETKEVPLIVTSTAPVGITSANPVTTSSAAPTTSSSPGVTAFSRVAIIGNSFTDYTGGRGYQASDAAHDYKHILTGYFQTLNSGVQVKSMADLSGQGIGDGPYWEGLRGNNLDGGLARFDVAKNFLAGSDNGANTLLIIRLGDNVPDATQNFGSNFLGLIQYIKASGSKVLVTSAAFPNKGDVNTAMQTVANAQNYTYVNLQGLPGINAGDANHANDTGMQNIADAIWAAIPHSTTSSTPITSSSPQQTSPYYAYGFGEGSYEQLVTSAPFIPTNNQYSSWPLGNTTQYLDNGIVRFGIGKSIGGAIKHIGMSGGGMNWVNTNAAGYPTTFEGQPAPDTGRSGGWSMYGTPGHNYLSNTNPQQNTNRHYDTGRNPVHGGSVYQDHSPITFFERKTVQGYGEVMYCRSIPYIWAFEGILADCTYHCWWWLEGNNTRYFTILDNQANDPLNQLLFQGSQQEGPFIYTTGNLYKHYIYDGLNPKSGGSLRDVSRTEVGLDSRPYTATEPWIASVDTNNNGVVLLSQHNSRMMGGQFVAFEGNEFSNESSYINSAQMMNWDVRQCTAFGGYIWAGSLQGFRNWYNQSNVQYRPFSFYFGQHNTCGWWSTDTPAKWNSSDRYEFTFGRPDGGGGNFCPPYGIYPASSIPTMYIDAAFSGGISKMDIRWNRTDQDDNQSNQANQVTTIDVIGDGQRRLYPVQMQGKAGWNNFIASMRFAPRLGDTPSPSWKMVPYYIGNVNPTTN